MLFHRVFLILHHVLVIITVYFLISCCSTVVDGWFHFAFVENYGACKNYVLIHRIFDRVTYKYTVQICSPSIYAVKHWFDQFDSLSFYGVISSYYYMRRKITKLDVNGPRYLKYVFAKIHTKKLAPTKGRGQSRYHPNSRHLHIGLSDCVTCSIRYLLLFFRSKIQLPWEIRFLSEPKETYSRWFPLSVGK